MESKAKKPGNYLAIGMSTMTSSLWLWRILGRWWSRGISRPIYSQRNLPSYWMGCQIDWRAPCLPMVWSDGRFWHWGVSMSGFKWQDVNICPSLVVILLGRLHFNLSQAIAAYIKLLPALSVGPTNDEEEKRRNTALFNTLFTKVLEEAGFNADTPMVDDKGPKMWERPLFDECISNAFSVPYVYPTLQTPLFHVLFGRIPSVTVTTFLHAPSCRLRELVSPPRIGSFQSKSGLNSKNWIWSMQRSATKIQSSYWCKKQKK